MSAGLGRGKWQGEKKMIIFISVFYQREIYNSLEANLGLNQGLCCDH